MTESELPEWDERWVWLSDDEARRIPWFAGDVCEQCDEPAAKVLDCREAGLFTYCTRHYSLVMEARSPGDGCEPVDLSEVTPTKCQVYWGSHGCDVPRGHGPNVAHACSCCDCDDHEAMQGHRSDASGEWLCVARPPYYGPETRFYGDDVEDAKREREGV